MAIQSAEERELNAEIKKSLELALMITLTQVLLGIRVTTEGSKRTYIRKV